MRHVLVAIVALAFACAGSSGARKTEPSLRSYFASDDAVKAGGVRMVPIRTPKGDFRVWTKRFGNNPRIKLLLLHGGPGGGHEYLEAFESLLAPEGIEFIYYDQLGSAYSDQPKDLDLWTIDRFVDEVEQVRRALGLDRTNFYLYGSSWGGMLAVEYALKHGEHLKALVISNMMMSVPDYVRYVNDVLAKRMDPAVLREIRQLEAAGRFEDPRYMELLFPNFYAKHLCRLPEWPEPVMRSFAKLNKDIYAFMQGPSEFRVTGTIAGWDRKADLGKLAMPVLVIGATHDTMDPEHMRWIAGQVQHGSFLFCPNGSHLAMWDDQETYGRGLVKFLRSVDAGQSAVSF